VVHLEDQRCLMAPVRWLHGIWLFFPSGGGVAGGNQNKGDGEGSGAEIFLQLEYGYDFGCTGTPTSSAVEVVGVS
jgi:hypothetical protein